MCIFCDIIEGKIPSYCVYEDDYVKAFLDISQVTKGHTLIVPKQHYDNFLSCDQDIMQHAFKAAQTLGKQISEKMHANGMNILSNINEVAGQSVNHFHIHLIPRYDENDACVIRFNESEKQDLNAILETICN